MSPNAPDCLVCCRPFGPAAIYDCTEHRRMGDFEIDMVTRVPLCREHAVADTVDGITLSSRCEMVLPAHDVDTAIWEGVCWCGLVVEPDVTVEWCPSHGWLRSSLPTWLRTVLLQTAVTGPTVDAPATEVTS